MAEKCDLLPEPVPMDLTTNELLSLDADIPSEEYPLRYALIEREQLKETALQQRVNSPGFSRKEFRGGNKSFNLVCYNDKIIVPITLRERVIKWYHEMLVHPGINRTEYAIRQHFTWPKLHEDVERLCKKCHTCQLTKRNKKNYGHLPAKIAETNPWETLCIDLIGPYELKKSGRGKKAKVWTLHCLTMIDPATGWFEIKEIKSKRADLIANYLEQAWFTRYPWPQRVICDRGSEFLAETRKMLQEDYGCEVASITTRNPQANAIVERVHQTIGEHIRTFQIHSSEIDEDDPFGGILSAVAFATRATVHTTLRATPAQLVFGRDAIINQPFKPDWEAIRKRKQELINKNNAKENSRRHPHTYRAGDQVLIKGAQRTKYGDNAYMGPVTILQVYDNGTVRYQKGNVIDKINIRNITPYTT